MEDLMSMAIMYIYPDGTVERIPIGEHTLHIEYMREHLKTSPKFYQICRGLDFYKSVLHGHIDSVLSLNGVVIVLNLDLEDIVKGTFMGREPYLLVAVPDKLHSLEQTLALEGVYESYPRNMLCCEKFSEKEDKYLSSDRFDITEYINDGKEQFSRNV